MKNDEYIIKIKLFLEEYIHKNANASNMRFYKTLLRNEMDTRLMEASKELRKFEETQNMN